ncbi:sensor domain-containing protein [Persephonella sp.]
MEKELEYIRKVLDNSPDIIFTISREGKIRYVNNTFTRYLGYTGEEANKLHILDLLENREAYEVCKKLVKEEGFCPDQEVFLKAKSGKKVKVIKRVRALRNEHGEIEEIIVNARDLTYLDILKEKLEEYAEALEFLIEKRTEELRGMKTFLEDVLKSVPDMLIVINEENHVVLNNKAAESILENNGDFMNRVYIVDRENNEINLSLFLKKEKLQSIYRTYNCFYKKNSEKIPFYIVISPIIQESSTRGFIILLKDISDVRSKEEKLLLYKTIFDNTLDAIGIVDSEGRYVDQNKSNEELLGYSIEEIKGKPFNQYLRIKDAEKTWEKLKKEGRLRFIATITNRKGEERYLDIVAMAVKDRYGRDRYYVGIKRDITDLIKREKELEELNKQLERRLYTDPLTDLPNRIKLIEDLKNVGSPKLAILNIDDFKEINDFYGYQVGDYILKELGSRIKKLLPQTGFKVYKLSGDEFAVLALRYIQSAEFERVINYIIYSIQESPVRINDYEIHLSLTAGISLENHNILNKADMALKYAKENKKPVVYYSEKLQMKELYETNILITRKIKEALKDERISVYYQPIFNNQTGKAEKFESLVRITDIDGRIILPGEFLEVAKKARLYPEIAKRVIKTTFENFRELPVEFTLNLSVKDIENREITELIFEYLSDERYSGRAIFEILESEGMENYEEVSAFIKEVKNLGGKISLDDFGAGYSNFEYILKLDVDYLKIDASLIKNIHTDLYSQIIVETIVGFAKRLGIRTIAEFVHNEDVHDLVKSLGIDYSQGYALGKPVPFEKISSFL